MPDVATQHIDPIDKKIKHFNTYQTIQPSSLKIQGTNFAVSWYHTPEEWRPQPQS
jgi:hypothetical protein